MNIKSLFSTAAVALLLASCSGAGSEQSATATPEQSAKADSLVYCFGQMRGAEYIRETGRDSLLGTPTAKQEYLRGVKAGLDAVKVGKDAYNKGLFQGIQMAININQFNEDYDIRLSDKVFLEGLSSTINSDTIVEAAAVQASFYKLMNEFNKAKEERDKATATAALKGAGEAMKLQELSDKLWGTKPAAGAATIKDGDKIKLDIVITTLNGKDINSTFPKELTVGQRLNNNPITEAVRNLTSGQSGTFLTSAQSLFGARAQQLGLKPADVLKLEITPTLQEASKGE